MDIARLTHLIFVLENVDPSKYDSAVWYSPATASAPERACAAGWAARDPHFRMQGLILKEGSPYFEGCTGFAALRKFFDLELYASWELFSISGPTSPAKAIAAIRNLLEKASDA